MRKRLFYAIVPAALILAFPLGTMAQMVSDSYRITTSVLSSGGTTMDSATYQVTATIGQSSCIGLLSSRNYINDGGFWHPDIFEVKRKAMPWIPLLLLKD